MKDFKLKKGNSVVLSVIIISQVLFLMLAGIVLLLLSNKMEIYLLIIICLLWIYGIVSLVKLVRSEINRRKQDYVSNVQINDKEIRFVCLLNKKSSTVGFEFAKIKNFKLDIHSNKFYSIWVDKLSSIRFSVDTSINVDIETEEDSFKFLIHADSENLMYSLLYAILDISGKMNNFSYNIEGTNKSGMEEAIKYYLNGQQQ